jgi:putative SOS response-associated peptidase YedK
MCGKFTQLVRWEDAAEFSQLLIMPENALVAFATPMRNAKVMRLDESGRRELMPMRWGFSKPRAPMFKPDHMHARGETVDSKPRFCDAFGERRGILLVETFNEGEAQEGGRTKQWVFSPKDRKPIAIAVVWEEWEGEAESVPCFIQITVPANPLVARITDRMPAILPQGDWPVWLGEVDAPYTEIKALLRTFDDQGNWEMREQSAANPKLPPPKANPQMDLF